MPGPLTTSRASRERRIVALAIWFSLIALAMVLWNTRTQRLEIANPTEQVAFLLAAFTTFVSLFAWMLFNPARGVSAETPTLMLAGLATMFPPCVIAYCTMSPGSPLSGWLTAGLFLLLLIAVMSPVPDEFFGIPRDRHSYMQSASALSIPEQFVVDQHPDWLQSTDLATAVSDSSRPSLAPRYWREDEEPFSRTSRRRVRAGTIDRQKERMPSEKPQRRHGLFRRRTEETESSEPQAKDNTPSRKQRGENAGLPVRPAPVEPPVERHPRDRRMFPTSGETADLRDRTATAGQKSTVGMDRDSGVVDSFTRGTQTEDERRVIPLADSHESGRDDIQVADYSRQAGFERIQDELGGEMIEGTAVIHFSRGQKRANVHVPFSPPLRGAPEVECSAIDHDFVRTKVPERRAWGIRIEGRRTDTSLAEDVEVAFSAVHVPTA